MSYIVKRGVGAYEYAIFQDDSAAELGSGLNYHLIPNHRFTTYYNVIVDHTPLADRRFRVYKRKMADVRISTNVIGLDDRSPMCREAQLRHFDLPNRTWGVVDGPLATSWIGPTKDSGH